MKSLVFSIILSLSIKVCFISCNVFDCEEGDACTGGIIKKVSECEGFLSVARKSLKKSMPCGFIGTEALICCLQFGRRIGDFESEPTEPTEKPEIISTEKIIIENEVEKRIQDSEAEKTEASSTEISIGSKAREACKSYGEKPDDSQEKLDSSSRIINGVSCHIGEFPHFTALGYNKIESQGNEISFDCGGALISNRFVITAAHCCKNSNKPVVVRLGRTALDIDNPDDASPYLDINIKAVYPYIKYRASRKHDDIALVELVEDVKFTHNIWPACLQLENTLEENNLIIAGFGRDNLTDRSSRSKWLMKAFVSEIPLEECKAEYEGMYKNTSRLGLFDGIKNDLICAKNRRIHVDTCQGDSGSALQLVKKGVYYVFGITSFGVSCNSSLPSFYTRVPNYIDWIEKIVWP